jgi:cytidylate kinase
MYIITIHGQSGTGKTTISKLLCSSLSADYIEVSDLVREIVDVKDKETMRNQHMQGKNEPKARELFNKILDRIKAIKSGVLVISGIREPDLLILLSQVLKNVISFMLIAKDEIRQSRLSLDSLAKLKELDKADAKLGFNSFYSGSNPCFISNVYDTTSLTPDQVASLIKHDFYVIVSYEKRHKW